MRATGPPTELLLSCYQAFSLSFCRWSNLSCIRIRLCLVKNYKISESKRVKRSRGRSSSFIGLSSLKEWKNLSSSEPLVQRLVTGSVVGFHTPISGSVVQSPRKSHSKNFDGGVASNAGEYEEGTGSWNSVGSTFRRGILMLSTKGKGSPFPKISDSSNKKLKRGFRRVGLFSQEIEQSHAVQVGFPREVPSNWISWLASPSFTRSEPVGK